MTNTLRGILKSILLHKGMDIQIGNYHASASPSADSLIVSIFHVKYLGFSQFEACVWNVNDKEITITNGDVCRDAEVIYILRTIKSTHQIIERVYAIYPHEDKRAKKDVTSKYQSYL